jgi:hypothetical protein
MNTKVTLHDQNHLAAPTGVASPAAEIIKAATQEHTVTDARGRQITLRKPGILAQVDLVEAVGNSAKNEVYFTMCSQLLYVDKIDGHDVPPLLSKVDVRALFQRLDEDGYEAVSTGIREHYLPKDDTDERDALKK